MRTLQLLTLLQGGFAICSLQECMISAGNTFSSAGNWRSKAGTPWRTALAGTVCFFWPHLLTCDPLPVHSSNTLGGDILINLAKTKSRSGWYLHLGRRRHFPALLRPPLLPPALALAAASGIPVCSAPATCNPQPRPQPSDEGWELPATMAHSHES